MGGDLILRTLFSEVSLPLIKIFQICIIIKYYIVTSLKLLVCML